MQKGETTNFSGFVSGNLVTVAQWLRYNKIGLCWFWAAQLIIVPDGHRRDCWRTGGPRDILCACIHHLSYGGEQESTVSRDCMLHSAKIQLASSNLRSDSKPHSHHPTLFWQLDVTVGPSRLSLWQLQLPVIACTQCHYYAQLVCVLLHRCGPTCSGLAVRSISLVYYYLWIQFLSWHCCPPQSRQATSLTLHSLVQSKVWSQQHEHAELVPLATVTESRQLIGEPPKAGSWNQNRHLTCLTTEIETQDMFVFSVMKSTQEVPFSVLNKTVWYSIWPSGMSFYAMTHHLSGGNLWTISSMIGL